MSCGYGCAKDFKVSIGYQEIIRLTEIFIYFSNLFSKLL